MAYSLTSLVDKVRQTLTGAVAQAPTTLSNIGNRVVGGYNEVAKALPLVPTTGEVRAFGLNPLRFMLDPRYNNGNNFSSSAPMKMASAFQGAIEQGAKAPGYLPSYFPKAILSAGQSIKTYMDPVQTPTLLSKQGLSNYAGAVAKTASPVLDVALLPKTPAKILLGSSVLGGGISGLLGAGQRLASGGSPGSAVSGLGSDLIQGAQQSLLQAPKISAIGSITNPAISKYAGQILAKFPQLSQSGANIINRILQGTMSVPEGYIMAKATGTDYNLTSAAIDFAVGSGLAKKAGEITQNKTKEISKMFPSETRAQALRRKAGFAGIRMKPNEGDHILYLIENELGKVNNEKNNRNFVLDTGALITMRDKLIRGTETPEDIRTAKDIFRRSGVDITPPKPFVVSGSGGYVDIGTSPKDKAIGQTSPPDPLIQEARKYKTADEFVKAQGEPLYHGTPYEFTDFKKGKTTFFTPDKNFAEEYGSSKSFARGLDADVKVLERQGKLNLFDSKNPEHIKKIEKLLPDEVGILGVMPGMGGKIPKAELLERIQGTFTHNTPKFAKEATKVGQMFDDMSIKHEGWWRIKEIKKNSVIAEKIENPNYAKNKQDLKVYRTEEFPRSGTYKTKGEPYWKDFEGDKGFEEAVQKAGFDGYKMTEKNSVTYGVFNPEKLLTKSQLTDIWNKANKAVEPTQIDRTQLTGRQLDMTNEQLAKAQVPVQKLQQQGRQIQMMEPLARGARQMAKAEAEVKAGVIGDELNTQDRTKLGQLKLVFQRADQNEGAWDVKSLSKNNKTLITWATERWREIYPYKANMTDDELINDIYSFVKDNQLSKKPKLDTPGIVKTMQQAREDQKTLARLSEYGEDQFPVRKGQPMTIADSEAQQKMIEQRLTKSGARDATLDELEAILNTPDNQLKGGYAIEKGPGIVTNAKGTGDEPQTFRGIINKFLGGKENVKLSQYEQVKPIADVKFTDEGAKQAIKAIETGDTDGLAPQIKEYVSTLRKSFDQIRSEAVADGLPIGYIDNYLTHYWEQPPDQVQAVINGLRKSGAFQKERVFLTYEEGINAGLTPRFKNPTQILGHYVRQVENIRNNLKLVKQLESNGYIISGDERKLVQGVREIAIPGFSGKFAKPEVARVIEGLFEPKEADKIIGTLAKISGKIQDVTLSGGIPGTPFNAFSVAGNLQKQFLSGRFSGPLKSFARAFSPGETTKYFQENIPVIREIQGAGYSLPTTLNYSKLIGDEAGGISKVWDATVSDPTFKRFIPMLQIDLYKEVKDKALKAGLSNDQALEKALTVLKNFEGMSDMYSRATQDPNARAVTQALFFAPKFRQAILGIWASSIKALKNPSALENQYNVRFLAGSILTYAAMNAANAYFNNGKMMWENGKNKEDKLIIPDGQGGEIGVPFLSSLGTIPRGIARQGMKILKGDISGAATDAGQTYLSSGIKPIADVMANQDYFGKKIVQPDSKNKWGDILSYLGRSYLSHPYIKELFDPRNTSDPGYQRLSRSMELPFRFYDKKSVDSSKYFEARDKALESLSEIEKKAYDAVPKYDEKNPDSQIFKYQTFLTYPNVFEAKRMTEFNLAKQTGKAIDPLYLVNYDTAKAFMRYETLPPGSQDRKDLLKIKPELAALFDVRSKYFKENPMEGQAKSSRPLPSEYIQQQMDAKNWSDPQVRAYLDANTQYQNEQRAKLGLAPLAGFTQFAKKPKRVSVKLAKANAPKIKLPKTKLFRIKMTKPLRLGKIRVRLK